MPACTVSASSSTSASPSATASTVKSTTTRRCWSTSLKIGYNNVFGYYIEVRNAHKDKVPQEWIRKQTLVNAERYITQELKEYEEKILGAEDKILVLETQLYNELVQALSEFIPAIQINANQVARLDCLLSFATAARENNYIRPVLSDDDVLDIRQGRHPVIEKQLPIGEKYVANDVISPVPTWPVSRLSSARRRSSPSWRR